MVIYDKKKGLYANINAKRKRIAAGSGEKMRKPGTKGSDRCSLQALQEDRQEEEEDLRGPRGTGRNFWGKSLKSLRNT